MLISFKTVLVAVAIGIVPLFVWLSFFRKRRALRGNRISGDFLLKILFWGVLAVVPAAILETIVFEAGGETQIIKSLRVVWAHEKSTLIVAGLVSAGLVAAIEEVSKGFAIAVGIKRDKVKSVRKGMLIGMLVGLAFGVTENGVYLATAIQNAAGPDFLSVMFLRFILSTSAHVVYSGLMGFLLAKAYNIGDSSEKAKKIIIALLIPIGVHTFFNILLGTRYNIFATLVVLAGFGYLWKKYHGSRI